MTNFYKGGRRLHLPDATATRHSASPQKNIKRVASTRRGERSFAQYEDLNDSWTNYYLPLQTLIFGLDMLRNKSMPCLMVLICFMLFNLSTAWAQSAETRAAEGQTKIEPLQIGDTIPEELWHLPLQVVNHPESKETITLADYKGKLIILDFWATWCSSCIKKFPEADSLQARNQNDLKILLVNSKSTRDTYEKADKFFLESNHPLRLTSVVEDTVLSALFPHTAIPHYVWIKGNKIVAFSHAEDVTAQNIQKGILGNKIKTHYVPEIEYDFRKPLFAAGNGGRPAKYIFRSVLAPFVNGLRGNNRTVRDANNRITRVTFINTNVLGLYRYVYPEFYAYSVARTVFEVDDKEPFLLNYGSTSWKEKHLYNYEIEIGPTSASAVKDRIRADLQQFFGYEVTVEHREVYCWILKEADRNKIMDSSQSRTQGATIHDVLTEMENRFKIPFINETGMGEEVEIEYPQTLVSLSEFTNNLESEGFHLTKEKRKIPVIILSTRNTN